MTHGDLKRAVAGLLCAGAVLGAAACGGGDETTASEPDLERYCELVGELNRASTEAFSEFEQDAQITDDEIVAAQRRVIEENEELFDELEQVAPEEIRDDLALSIESSRERAQQGDASPPPQEVADAGIRLQEFRREECRRG